MKNKIYSNGAWEFSSIDPLKGEMENQKKWKQLAQKLEDKIRELTPHCYP